MSTSNQKKAPLAIVKERYGDKDKLVSEVVALLEPRADESRSQMKTRLSKVSNTKLLRLLERARGGASAR